MKNLILLLLTFITLFATACNTTPQQTTSSHITKTAKIVRDKKEANETSYHYKYNVFRGSFYQQPDIHTVYYLIYKDGSYNTVDIGKYSTTSIGDTIFEYNTVYN